MSTLIVIEGENYMLNELIARYPLLASIRDEIENAYNTIVECYENDGKVLIVGNGGSAADAEHIVGELMKGFVKNRTVSQEMQEALMEIDPERGAGLIKNLQGGLPAICLNAHTSLNTAFANDKDPVLS